MRQNSIITDIFYIQLINIFRSDCGKEFYSFQKLLDIPLLLTNINGDTNLKELIKEFMKDITVNLNEDCTICKLKKENIKKKIRLILLMIL